MMFLQKPSSFGCPHVWKPLYKLQIDDQHRVNTYGSLEWSWTGLRMSKLQLLDLLSGETGALTGP